MKTNIKSGISQPSGAHHKYVEVETKMRTYVLQESEVDQYYLSIERHKDKRTYEPEGPFDLFEGLGNLFVHVLAEEGYIQHTAKHAQGKQPV